MFLKHSFESEYLQIIFFHLSSFPFCRFDSPIKKILRNLRSSAAEDWSLKERKPKLVGSY